MILPGGFSHGDYLRTGAIAQFSPVMAAVREFAAGGGPVLGICNGFQMLCEAQMLPGAMLRNRDLKFHCEHVCVSVERTDTPFTARASRGQVLRLPIAHGEGNYFADAETLARLEAENRVIFRYCDASGRADEAANPNGSLERDRRHLQRGPQRRGPDAAPRARLRVAARQRRRSRPVRLGRRRARGERRRDGLTKNDHAPHEHRRRRPARTSRPQARRIRPHRAALGREPTLTELGIFSVMWSEHCSYKSSRVHLRTLPTKGPRVLQGPGENAGAVDIGDGLAAVFKIESHNHPSFIEPYQGAATGVGGIIRDIFTMGARPIALLNSLRFGPMDGPHGARTRRIVEGVVAGIAGYGNSIGIPTIGGEVVFEERYTGNPLVNVFCLGLAKADALVKGRADGVGNPVYYVGAKTGRDGIHGATMASAEFDEKSAEKRPAVQVGDPFMEKLLLEACLELMESDALIGVQDMGAAGLTCSTCEMGARGGSGIEIDVRHVPQRETGMTPYEIMLSESQERMLLVVKKGREARGRGDLREVGPARRARRATSPTTACCGSRHEGRSVAEIPNTALVDEAPVYDRPMSRPAYLDEVAGRSTPAALPDGRIASTALLRLLGAPTIASKRWIYRQYDHMVRTNTIVLAGMGAGVVRVKGTTARAGDVGRRQRPLLLPRSAARRDAGGGRGGAQRRLRRRPSDRRDQLPELRQPGAARDHVAVRRGRRRASARRAARSTSRSPAATSASTTRPTASAIYPTPVIGVVGVIEDAVDGRWRARSAPTGTPSSCSARRSTELGGSEYLKMVHGLVRGRPPALDLRTRARADRRCWSRRPPRASLRSAHDCSDGGLAVTLAECAFDTGGIGCDVDLPAAGAARVTSALFSRVGLARRHRRVPEASVERAAGARGRERGVPAQRDRPDGRLAARDLASADATAIDCVVREAEQVLGERAGNALPAEGGVEFAARGTACSTSSRTSAACSASSGIPKRPT